MRNAPHRTPSLTSTPSASAGVRSTTATATALLTAAVLGTLAILLIAASPAHAVSDEEELTRFGGLGSGAGELREPGKIATDAATGHVYVTDFENNRISEFTAWGEFVKAFGWDVAPGAVNEQQEIRVRAATGQFKLTFGASTTPDLPLGADATELEAALNGLASIGPGGVSVTENPGTPTGTTPYVYAVSFKGSGLDETDVTQIGAANGTTPLSGGNPSSSLEVRTRADGGPSGSGLEACTEESGCKQGVRVPGSGAGEISPQGIAADSKGDLYVYEGNNRVEKFTPAGQFLLMFGGEVNKTKSAEVGSSEAERNLCTRAQLEGGDVCGAGTKGAGQGQFANPFSSGPIAIGPDDMVFVDDVERIEAFEPDGTFKDEIKHPGGNDFELAVDPKSGDFYLPSSPKKSVLKLSPSGTQLGELPVEKPSLAATDLAGNVYIADLGILEEVNHRDARVFQFDSSGKPLSPPSCCIPEPLPGSTGTLPTRFSLSGLGTNAIGDLYVTNNRSGVANFVTAYGPPPVNFESPPPLAPTIASEYAISVATHDATVGAEINPHFFNDTTYYLEYGDDDCAISACAKKPAAPGSKLTAKVVDKSVKVSVLLDSLKPGSTYHYRFVAQGSGGGPTFGPDRIFHTFPATGGPEAGCPNQAFRTGLGAKLPDCRAYEMVSPVDKSGGDILVVPNIASLLTGLTQSSLDGEKLTYSSYRAFGNSKASGYSNQYIASRGKDGWSSEAINPARGPGFYTTNDSLEDEFKAFSPDLCHGWLVHEAEPLLAPGAVEGFPNVYRRDSCAPESGDYEALSTAEPPSVPAQNYTPELQGYSVDGAEAIFRVDDKLTDDATGGGKFQVYESSGGALHLVCILPNGTPSKEHCSAGTAPTSPGPYHNRTASVTGAMSADGSRVYWSESPPSNPGIGGGLLPGRLYLRENADQPQSALSGSECTEPEAACTVAVSQAGAGARYWGASPNGARALYVVEDGALQGNLYLFDLQNEASPRQLIAKGVAGVLGSSEDLSRVYFVSSEAIAGTSGATAKEPNLYLYEAGDESEEASFTFIATLSSTDTTPKFQISNTAREPIYHAPRVSPDGRHLAFISTASLTGYDNIDLNSGDPDSEVYLYEVGAAGPICVSCNPSGARPAGRQAVGTGDGGTSGIILATAASLPSPQTELYAPRVLSDDGSQLFFNSYDALLPRDTNGKKDAYEWERAGSGSCEKSSLAFSVANGGCIYLLSTGESPQNSELIDIKPDGRDVFITTNSSLLPQDPGLVDIYNARAGGGLPPPPPPPPACVGDACQPVVSPPNDPTPASASFKGAGDPAPRNRNRGRCGAGKQRVTRNGRTHCEKKRKRTHHRRAAR